jgi:large subunit ribosomal protein L31e
MAEEEVEKVEAKTEEVPKESVERIYTIPLRKIKSAPRGVRTELAIKLIQRFLRRHVGDVKLDPKLNQAVWAYGIKHPPSRIRIKVIKGIVDDKEIRRAEPAEEVADKDKNIKRKD